MGTAARIAACVVVVVAINVLLHVVALPQVDFPSLDPPGWLHAVLRAKNFLLLIAGGVIEENRRGGE